MERVKSILVDPSPRMQHAKSTVAFKSNEGEWIVKRLYSITVLREFYVKV